MHTLHVVTYNIHKGFSQFNRRLMVHELRAQLDKLNPDVVFLQEVQGKHDKHTRNHEHWPDTPQHEFLSAEGWHHRYGHNVVYDHGHHGNAILSRFPIVQSHNQDVTHLRFEKRGLLHCTLQPAGWDQPLHCVCVHLSLFAASRRRQMMALTEAVNAMVPADAPLIIAGDFNDWRNQAHEYLAQPLGMSEVFCGNDGRPSRSFPVALPLLRLDRIYARGFTVSRCEVLNGGEWVGISDHAALSAHVALNSR